MSGALFDSNVHPTELEAAAWERAEVRMTTAD
jgi:hypothetical protein